AVGDRVWLDVDGLGDQTSGEVGVAAVTVRLYDGQEDALLATTTTDADGMYLFDGLPAGFYYVGFVLSTLPADHNVTVQDAFLETIDSDGDEMTGRTVAFSLAAGQTDLSWDLGVFFQQVSPTTIVTTTSIAPTTIATTTETLPFTGFGRTGLGRLGVALVTFGGLVLLTIGRKEGDHAIPSEGSAQRIWEG
ncbi:MAG: hypothetical protein OEX97_07905, partial [Acidimicrobiia bacterium]|nr:hypothetical protein [Acidimicrobiia bacterium]